MCVLVCVCLCVQVAATVTRHLFTDKSNILCPLFLRKRFCAASARADGDFLFFPLCILSPGHSVGKSPFRCTCG